MVTMKMVSMRAAKVVVAMKSAKVMNEMMTTTATSTNKFVRFFFARY
jgi:hypothetical protein